MGPCRHPARRSFSRPKMNICVFRRALTEGSDATAVVW
uniref:Uncharacterized protein n=1 Tax=Anguilla anguilla TaxID=7936 RepID=A0A0E9UYS7_ANGAN